MAKAQSDSDLFTMQPTKETPEQASARRKEKKRQGRAELAARTDIEIPIDKFCVKCGETKPSDQFHKSRVEKDGLKGWCKVCAKHGRADWYQRNRGREIAKVTDYIKKHPELGRLWKKVSYIRHRDVLLPKKRQIYIDNKDSILERNRLRYATDEDYRLDRVRRSDERYASRDPADLRRYAATYRDQNRKAVNLHSASYRALKVNADGRISLTEWHGVLYCHGYRCAYCLGHEDNVGTLAMDHMLPLSRGGRHDANNIVPSCKVCNSAKSDSTPLEFLSRLSIGGYRRRRKRFTL